MGLLKLFHRKTGCGVLPAVWLSRLRSGLEMRQHRVADWLGRKTQYWSKSSWLVALGLFVALFGGCCLWLILKVMV